MSMSPEDLEKKKAELAAAEEKIKKEKEEEEKKKKEKEEELEKEKEKEEEEKLKSIVGDKEAVTALLEAKRKANAEAKEYRLKLAEMEKKIKDAEDKDLEKKGEYEKLAAKAKADLEEAQRKFKEQLITNALKIEVTKAGAIDPDVYKMVDRSGIKVDNDFNVTGAEEAVAAYKKLKPQLFGEESQEPEDSGKPGGTLRDTVLKGAGETSKKPRQLIADAFRQKKKKK